MKTDPTDTISCKIAETVNRMSNDQTISKSHS